MPDSTGFIRAAEPGDVSALAQLLGRVGWWEDIARDPERAVRHILAQIELCRSDPQHLLWVYERNGSLLAYLSMHFRPYLFMLGQEAYLAELFVHPDQRGEGIGGRMLSEAEAEARRRGCTRMMLVTKRRRQSYQRGFYRKHGWQERPQVANFVLPLKD